MLLAITETAATAIRSLTSAQEESEEAGVRIAAREGGEVGTAALEISLAAGPAENDQVVEEHGAGEPELESEPSDRDPGTHQVVEEHGAHVFLEPRAASYLDDKLLDANIDGQQVRFAVSDQR